MSIYCPILEEKVTYLQCQDCEEKICKQHIIKDSKKLTNLPPHACYVSCVRLHNKEN